MSAQVEIVVKNSKSASGIANENSPTIKNLLESASTRAASDLLLMSGSPPAIFGHGIWQELSQIEMNASEVRRLIDEMLTPQQRETLERDRDLDFAFSVPGLGRYRVNVHFQRGEPAAAIRAIPAVVPAFDTLGLPEKVLEFADYPSGLVLITGGTGQGKSTTLASIIHHMNQHRRAHVVTIEDPIEFDFQKGTCLIEQREVGQDTPSFASALRHILRQRPDVILIGEMRDLETIGTALTAAETGHLVLASLHTASAAQTIARVIDVFPPTQQLQVRTQLAASLRAILCQHLISDAAGSGLVAASELLIATTAIRRAIRENEAHLIYSMIETGRREGMHTLEQCLVSLVRVGSISADCALAATSNADRLETLLGGKNGIPKSDSAGETSDNRPGMDLPWA